MQNAYASSESLCDQRGSRGYVNKQDMSESVLVAIRRLLDGGKYLSPKTDEKLADI